MAETKASSSKTGGSKKAAEQPSGTAKKAGPKRSKASSKSSKASSKSSKAKSSKTQAKARRVASPKSSSNGSASSGASGLKAVRDSVSDAGHKVGRVAGEGASKAKIPLIAGGAAAIGAASGIALAASRAGGSKVLGVKMPRTKVKISSRDLAKSADRVARAGEQIGRLSTGLRELQGTSGSGNGNDQKRSPVEVLIQGLTRRR